MPEPPPASDDRAPDREHPEAARPIRVGIVDDHPAVIVGTMAILRGSAGITVVAAATSVRELLATGSVLDLVLLDLNLADASTPTSNILTLSERGIPAVAFTSGERPALVREAARAGAVGMIRKSVAPAVIVNAVLAVRRDGVVASADWAASLDDDHDFVTARLSARESEVLALYASGETAERVATELFISRSTVIEHVRRIRDKYAAISRPARTKHDLYLRAVEDGVLDRGDDR